MTFFAVLRERGDAWDASRSMSDQDSWNQHAAFMNALVEDGIIVLGGPIGDQGTILLIVNSDSKEQVRAHFAADPWTPMQLLRVTSIEPWQILLGNAPVT